MTVVMGRLARLAPIAAVLVLVLAAAGRLITDGPAFVRDWDTSATRWLADHRAGWLLDAAYAGTYLSDTYTVIAATAVLAAAAGWWTRRWWLPAGLILLTAGETAVYELSNSLVDRPRPAVPRLDPGDPMASFPSGHVAAAVCLYAGVAAIVLRLGRRHAAQRSGTAGAGTAGAGTSTRWRVAGALAVAVAVLVPLVVAFCRTFRGMHHPTDVLAGALLGVCWLLAVDRFVLARAVPSHGPIARATRSARPARSGRTTKSARSA